MNRNMIKLNIIEFNEKVDCINRTMDLKKVDEIRLGIIKLLTSGRIKKEDVCTFCIEMYDLFEYVYTIKLLQKNSKKLEKRAFNAL